MEQKYLIFSIFLSLIAMSSMVLLAACNMDGRVECEGGMYDEDGNCCAAVCTLYCENGYVDGSCGCQCKPSDGNNLDDVFGDDDSIKPPVMPQ